MLVKLAFLLVWVITLTDQINCISTKKLINTNGLRFGSRLRASNDLSFLSKQFSFVIIVVLASATLSYYLIIDLVRKSIYLIAITALDGPVKGITLV